MRVVVFYDPLLFHQTKRLSEVKINNINQFMIIAFNVHSIKQEKSQFCLTKTTSSKTTTYVDYL